MADRTDHLAENPEAFSVPVPQQTSHGMDDKADAKNDVLHVERVDSHPHPHQLEA